MAPLHKGPGSVPGCAQIHPRPHVIRVPWLSDVGVCVPELSDEREEPYAICDHGQGDPLGHSFLAMQEVA